jgi:leucyl-tRNA---protein transferase
MTTVVPLRLLLGTEQPCGYLPRRLSRSAFVAPHLQLDGNLYGALLEQGFRRSGDYAYRPACAGCAACVPVRLRVTDFAPTRSQRRCLHRNAGLAWQRETALDDEHFALYRRYLLARHPFGGMDADDTKAFREFLGSRWGITEFWAFREQGVLRIVAVVDVLPQGLSAVYTFFDPDLRQRSLGSFAILQQIQECRRLGHDHLYLGYWVDGSATMDYKRHFRPLEAFNGRHWRPLDGG